MIPGYQYYVTFDVKHSARYVKFSRNSQKLQPTTPANATHWGNSPENFSAEYPQFARLPDDRHKKSPAFSQAVLQ
ncbi:hypothetical protein DVF89_07670 [Salmonella enterica subsp. enterica]|nr:hypothetical protein [Salmonella enterica subsp. enterica serovar Kinondoni]